MDTHSHNHLCQRHTTRVFNRSNHVTDPVLDPPKAGPQFRCRLRTRNRPPKRCPPTVGGHTLGGSKVDPKSGPSSGAVKQSLLVEISERLELHVPPEQRSNGSHGSQSMPEALWCVHGKPDRAGGPVSKIHRKTRAGRSMPEAVLYTTGKPDDAGGPPQGSIYA